MENKTKCAQGRNCCHDEEAALLVRLGEMLSGFKGKEGSLIQALHAAQGLYG